jgi:hypothetical protein
LPEVEHHVAVALAHAGVADGERAFGEAEQEHVLARPAGQPVPVAVAAPERVVARPARQGVEAAAALDAVVPRAAPQHVAAVERVEEGRGGRRRPHARPGAEDAVVARPAPHGV